MVAIPSEAGLRLQGELYVLEAPCDHVSQSPQKRVSDCKPSPAARPGPLGGEVAIPSEAGLRLQAQRLW